METVKQPECATCADETIRSAGLTQNLFTPDEATALIVIAANSLKMTKLLLAKIPDDDLRRLQVERDIRVMGGAAYKLLSGFGPAHRHELVMGLRKVGIDLQMEEPVCTHSLEQRAGVTPPAPLSAVPTPPPSETI